MKFQSQKVAYWFFASALILFSLQIVYGFIMGFAHVGYDVLHAWIPFNTARAVHTNLLVMWLLLNGFTLGHLILGIFVAVFASWAMASLRPQKPRLVKWYLLPKLFLAVLYDILKSNVAVAGIIIRSGSRQHDPGFLTIHLEMRSPFALAVLAVILTSTPGSAWLEYDSNENSVLLHVLDLQNETVWRDTIKNRYEKLLMEIFA